LAWANTLRAVAASERARKISRDSAKRGRLASLDEQQRPEHTFNCISTPPGSLHQGSIAYYDGAYKALSSSRFVSHGGCDLLHTMAVFDQLE